MKAIVLAAGLGTRMAPLTPARPKPILPVLDRSLLLRHMESLARAGIERIVVNTHAGAEQVRQEAARSGLAIEISHEPELLGSGGAIRRARRYLEGPEPFLVVNADMCVDFDLGPLLDVHSRSAAAVTLLLRDDPQKEALGSIGYGIEGRVCRIVSQFQRAGETGSGLFTGIALMGGDIFGRLPDQEAFEIIPGLWIPLLSHGGTIAAAHHDPARLWEPVGTPRELLRANLAALARPGGAAVAASAKLHGSVRAPVFIGEGARIEPGAQVGPDAVVGAGAVVPAGACVRRALLLPGAELSPGQELCEGIAFDREVWRDA